MVFLNSFQISDSILLVNFRCRSKNWWLHRSAYFSGPWRDRSLEWLMHWLHGHHPYSLEDSVVNNQALNSFHFALHLLVIHLWVKRNMEVAFLRLEYMAGVQSCTYPDTAILKSIYLCIWVNPDLGRPAQQPQATRQLSTWDGGSQTEMCCECKTYNGFQGLSTQLTSIICWNENILVLLG